MSSSSSLHRPSSQHKPVIVRTPSFGTGIVTERRSDGVSVVQLPWGKVFLEPQSVVQVISGQCKRTRYEEAEADDEREAVRRKQEEQSSDSSVTAMMQWQHSQQQSTASPSSVYCYPS